MKTKILILFSLLSFTLFSQNRGFNYKALISENGTALSNQNISLQFTILENGTTNVYQETQSVTTDDNGIISVSIGEGDVESGDFTTIDWSNSQYLKVEIDTGSGYADFGTSEFKAVPFAKHAEHAANGGGAKSIDELSDAKTTSSYGSIFLGSDAGTSEALSGDVEANIGIGKNALKTVSSGHRNIAIGTSALEKNNGSGNVAIGNFSLINSISSDHNTVVGLYAFANNRGNNNVALGYATGINNYSGSGNVFIGNKAGFYERGSNKLYIDNSSTEKPLIGGDFATDMVSINGSLGINNNYSDTGNLYGIKIIVNDSSTTSTYSHIGIYNEISGISKDTHYGIKNVITAGTTTAPQYGTYNEVSTTGSAYKYGTYNKIPNTNSGYGIAVYGEATGVDMYAGFFRGNVEITNTIKISGNSPGAGKVLTSDANGLANWQTPASFNDLWGTDGSNVYRNTGNVGIGTTSPTSPLEIKSNALNTLIIGSKSTNTSIRPGIQFKNNTSQFISGDDVSNEIFGFYSTWANARTYDARLRVYGKATSSWGKYIELTHDGTDATIRTDAGNISISPADNEVIIDGKITSQSSGNDADLKAFAYGTIWGSDGHKLSGTNNFHVDHGAGVGIYKITFDGENYDYEHFTTVITPIGTTTPVIACYYAVNNTLVIKLFNHDGTTLFVSHSFSFITYKQ